MSIWIQLSNSRKKHQHSLFSDFFFFLSQKLLKYTKALLYDHYRTHLCTQLSKMVEKAVWEGKKQQKLFWQAHRAQKKLCRPHTLRVPNA